MEATFEERLEVKRERRWREALRREDELATLSAHLSAATARFVALAWEHFENVSSDDPAGFLAYRCGLTRREAQEMLRVAEALQELPVTRAAFARGELTLTKVRALTWVATPSTEESLLDLAGLLTASQLERALRAFRRVVEADVRETHELEYVDYRFEEDGTLYLRARLAAEDGVVLVKALEAARERVLERRREEPPAAALADAASVLPPMHNVQAPRSTRVEALVELAESSLTAADERHVERPARLVVHVDAAALTSGAPGRCELEGGPQVAVETARRLGCDAELVAQVERDGLPVSVGRRRRTVPPALRRLLEARDGDVCCFPGCERRRHLQAHHRRHWAEGGETSLDNLVLLCWHHHRLVHEGGYRVEDDPEGGLLFRNRFGVLCSSLPPRPPPGSADELAAGNHRRGLTLGPTTNRNGCGDQMDLHLTVYAIASVFERAA